MIAFAAIVYHLCFSMFPTFGGSCSPTQGCNIIGATRWRHAQLFTQNSSPSCFKKWVDLVLRRRGLQAVCAGMYLEAKEVGNRKKSPIGHPKAFLGWSSSLNDVLPDACSRFWVPFPPVNTNWSHKQQTCLIVVFKDTACTIRQRSEDTPTVQNTGFILVSHVSACIIYIFTSNRSLCYSLVTWS